MQASLGEDGRGEPGRREEFLKRYGPQHPLATMKRGRMACVTGVGTYILLTRKRSDF